LFISLILFIKKKSILNQLLLFIFLVLPTFTTHPENLTLKSGDVADLHCVAEGYPRPKISWFRDGKQLVTAGRIAVLGKELQ